MFNNITITVSQVNSYIKLLLEGDKNLKNIFILGEISDFKHNFSSGHAYFSLKDDIGVIKAVMFSRYFNKLNFIPNNGMHVLVRGSISLYEISGQYQICVEDMQPDGLGKSYIKVQNLKIKLEQEGLLDDNRKRSLPRLPQKVGIITSASGSVIHDIENIIERRYPICKIEVFSSSVQGENSENEIIEGINYFNNKSVNTDVIIIARGGGSTEDLSVFNKENLARAISSSEIPIISAVGHETDWTICDYVSDIRASTPSVAAELAVPDKKEIFNLINEIEKRILFSFKNMLRYKKDLLEYKLRELNSLSPINKIFLKTQRINDIEKSMIFRLEKIFNELKFKVNGLSSKLEAMDPKNVLSRGYVVASSGGKDIHSILDVEEGKQINLQFIDGNVSFLVSDIRRKSIEK